jgi:hypothetical protein
MSQRNKQIAKATAAGALVAVGLGFPAIAGGNEYFDEYLARRDTITVAPGNATDTNKAVQSFTRWPRASREDRWLSDGEVARRAAVRYRTNKVTLPRTLSNTGENTVPQAAETPDVQPAGN